MNNTINNYPEFSKDNPFGSQSKMLYHLDRVQEYISTGDTFPIFMEVNLTDVCNMRCSWCISDNRLDAGSLQTLEIESLKRFIIDFSTHGGKALTWSGGGEPTLYKYFEEITLLARDCGIDLGLMTNGAFNKKYIKLIGENFKWVRISLDTLNKDLYKKWKGVDFVDKVLENISLLRSYKTKVGINVNVNVDMEVNDIKNLIDSLYKNCDYIQFRPVLPRYFKDEGIAINNPVWGWLKTYQDDPKINLSYDKFKDLKSNSQFPFKTCEGHYFSPILNADGDIKVCMYHPNRKEFSFGNINRTSLMEIWKSDKRQETIEFVRNFDYKNNCQQCCKLYELNKFIDFIKSPSDKLDINFL